MCMCMCVFCRGFCLLLSHFSSRLIFTLIVRYFFFFSFWSALYWIQFETVPHRFVDFILRKLAFLHQFHRRISGVQKCAAYGNFPLGNSKKKAVEFQKKSIKKGKLWAKHGFRQKTLNIQQINCERAHAKHGSRDPWKSCYDFIQLKYLNITWMRSCECAFVCRAFTIGRKTMTCGKAICVVRPIA